MILSKDDNTLNLTTSILSAKSMLQTKLDEIGIDIKVIERNLDTLKTEVTELKKEVEETKEELVTAAEELKATTDNEAIKHKIDEVQTELDEVEINDDFLDGLCLTTCNMMDGGCDCFGAGFNNEPSSCTDCYGYSEVGHTEWADVCAVCYGDYCIEVYWDSDVCVRGDCTESYCADKYDICQADYCQLGFSIGNKVTCMNEFSPQECKELGDSRVDSLENEGHTICANGYKTDGLECGDVYSYDDDDYYSCGIKFSTENQKCEHTYNVQLDDEGKVDHLKCLANFDASGKSCHIEYTYDGKNDICERAFKDGNNQCAVNYIESNGVVSCEMSHAGDDGTCSKDHTWSDGIGGQCKGVFNNSQMNCQGGVASNEAEQQLLCDGDYTAGNINCAGGYAEDTDDRETFCPSNFSDGHTTCRSMYMKQNGVETCSNKDPISCRGGCVGSYCDYCGGCVGNCDSCRGCHGSSNCGSCDGSCVSSCDGNCWHTTVNTCTGCYPTPYSTTCGSPSCGGGYNYCASNGWDITCTGGF